MLLFRVDESHYNSLRIVEPFISNPCDSIRIVLLFVNHPYNSVYQ
jgi:hypothetical protein